MTPLRHAPIERVARATGKPRMAVLPRFFCGQLQPGPPCTKVQLPRKSYPLYSGFGDG